MGMCGCNAEYRMDCGWPLGSRLKLGMFRLVPLRTVPTESVDERCDQAPPLPLPAERWRDWRDDTRDAAWLRGRVNLGVRPGETIRSAAVTGRSHTGIEGFIVLWGWHHNAFRSGAGSCFIMDVPFR